VRALRSYLLLGFIIFLIVAAATLPASLLTGLLPARVALKDVTGTLWEGTAGELQLDATPLGALHWRVSPFSLLHGRLSGDLALTHPDGHVSGEVTLRRGGILEVTQLRLDLPLTTLHPEHPQNSWDGRVQGEVIFARLEQGWPLALQGRFILEHVHAPNARDDLGRFVLDFDPRDAQPTALLGRLRDDGGPVAVTAQLRLLKTRAYQLDGDVAARGALSDELARALAFLGTPADNGRRPLTITGTF